MLYIVNESISNALNSDARDPLVTAKHEGNIARGTSEKSMVRKNSLKAGMMFAIVLASISLISHTARAQNTGCGCDSINIGYVSGPSNDPCPNPSVGGCGTCVCKYLNVGNESMCVIDSIDIRSSPDACANFCAWNKNDTGQRWDCNPPVPGECLSTLPVGISPAVGTSYLMPYSMQPNNSEVIIKICSGTTGKTYHITFHFADGTTCSETFIPFP
jgi:hypothetical protein